MRKVSWLFASLALLAFTACGKKDGGGNNNSYAYSPGQCNPYQSNNGNNQFSTGQYQWRNNVCVDISSNRQVPGSYCSNSGQYYWQGSQCIDRHTGSAVNQIHCQNQGNTWDPNCYNNGAFPIYGGNLWNATNVCSSYNRAGVIYYPVHYPGTGKTVCVGYAQVMTMYNSYGYWPMLYGNGAYGNMFRGCTNNSRCKCVSIGASFLSASAGICM